jgi:PhzF family phenazine biosynthesis protein
LTSAARVRAVQADHAALKGLAKVGLIGLHDAAAGLDGAAGADVEVRAFAAQIGVAEDPVTGSLNAALAQWLIADGVLPAAYVASQGHLLGRAGRIHLRREGETVWVGGDVAPGIDGSIML